MMKFIANTFLLHVKNKNKLFCKITCESEVVEQSETNRKARGKVKRKIPRSIKTPSFPSAKLTEKFRASPHRIVFPKRGPFKSNPFADSSMEIFEMYMRPGESIESSFRKFRNHFFFWSLDEDVFSFNFLRENIYQTSLKSYTLFFNELMVKILNLSRGYLKPNFCYQLSRDIYKMILKDPSFEVILDHHNIKSYLEILIMTTCKPLILVYGYGLFCIGFTQEKGYAQSPYYFQSYNRIKIRSYLGGNYQLLIKRLFSSYQYAVMKKTVTKNVIQQIISDNVIKVICPLVLMTPEFTGFLLHLMEQFYMRPCAEKLIDEVNACNRQEILREYGLGVLGQRQFSLPGFTIFQTSSKINNRNLQEIILPRMSRNGEPSFDQPVYIKKNLDANYFYMMKHQLFKVETLKKEAAPGSRKLTPSARRNMNLETMEANGDKAIVKVDDIKGEADQEYIQLSLDKSDLAPKRGRDKPPRPEKWSTTNLVGKKRESVDGAGAGQTEVADDSRKKATLGAKREQKRPSGGQGKAAALNQAGKASTLKKVKTEISAQKLPKKMMVAEPEPEGTGSAKNEDRSGDQAGEGESEGPAESPKTGTLVPFYFIRSAFMHEKREFEKKLEIKGKKREKANTIARTEEKKSKGRRKQGNESVAKESKKTRKKAKRRRKNRKSLKRLAMTQKHDMNFYIDFFTRNKCDNEKYLVNNCFVYRRLRHSGMQESLHKLIQRKVDFFRNVTQNNLEPELDLVGFNRSAAASRDPTSPH